MKTLIVFFCALLTAGVGQAQNYSIIMRQARDASNAAAKRSQAGLTPTTPAAPAQSVPAPNPVLQATLQNIQNLRNDFATLARLTNTASITTEKQALTNDLGMAALGIRPPQPSISKLADDLAAAIVGNGKLRAQHPRLAQYVHAVFNSSQLSSLQQEMIFDNTQTMLTGCGVAPDIATNVVSDIKAIVNETK